MKRILTCIIAGTVATAGAVAHAAPAIATETVQQPNASQITQQQRTLLAEKLALIAQIMRASGTEQTGPQLSADQRRWMLESLARMPVAELRTVGLPGGFEAVSIAIEKTRAKEIAGKPVVAKLGQLNTELVFIPIAPCRYIDTRNVGGPLPNDSTRGYDLDLTGNFHGGVAACDPKSFVGGVSADQMGAIFMNVTIVGPPGAPGFLGVRPAGSSNTTSLVNWYEAGDSVQAANAAIIPINQSLATNEIEFFGTQTHIIADVMGLFAAPTSTPLDCVQGSLTSIVLNTPGSNYNLVAGTCPTGFGMVSNSCQSLGDTASLRQAGGGVVSSTNATCVGRYEGVSSVTVTNTPWCCRLPGR